MVLVNCIYEDYIYNYVSEEWFNLNKNSKQTIKSIAYNTCDNENQRYI